MKLLPLAAIAVAFYCGWVVYDSTQPTEPYVVISTSTGGNKATGDLQHSATCVPEAHAGTWDSGAPWPDAVPYKEVWLTEQELTALTDAMLAAGDDNVPCPEKPVVGTGTT